MAWNGVEFAPEPSPVPSLEPSFVPSPVPSPQAPEAQETIALARYLGISTTTLAVAVAVVSVSPYVWSFLRAQLLPAEKSLGPKVLIFDVNETMIDMLGGLKPVIVRVLDRASAYEEFYRQLILIMHTLTMTGSYKNFTELLPVAFSQVVGNSGITGKDAEVEPCGWQECWLRLNELRAHPDVAPGLSALKRQGWKLIAFSDGNQAMVTKQMQKSRILEKFDKVLSVEAVRAFKPQAVCYHYALKQAGVSADEAIFVSTHDWDLEGAKSAGLKTAYVQRHLASGTFHGTYRPPDYVADHFVNLARKLIPIAPNPTP